MSSPTAAVRSRSWTTLGFVSSSRRRISGCQEAVTSDLPTARRRSSASSTTMRWQNRTHRFASSMSSPGHRHSARSRCGSSTKPAAPLVVTCPVPAAVSPERSGDVALFLGGASAVRVEAYSEVGGYFTELFYGHEEVEMCWRLVDAGWRIRYLADVTVFHPRTDIGRHVSGWRLTGRNRVWVARRTLPWPVALVHVAAWLLLGVIRDAERRLASELRHTDGSRVGVHASSTGRSVGSGCGVSPAWVDHR